MRNFIWPTSRNPSPGAVTRFGRVLHWIATATSVPLVVFGIGYVGLAAYQSATNAGSSYSGYFYPYWPNTIAIGLFAIAVALLFYFAGRALRYIFSGE